MNRVERADGSVMSLDHIGTASMAPGDVFVIETPGGGGYGRGGPGGYGANGLSRAGPGIAGARHRA